MTARSATLLRWSPRILGILVCIFLGLFALDAFGMGKGIGESLADFGIHLLPVLALLAVVALSWRYEWVGGVVFTALSALYAYGARAHPSWVVVIAGPLLVVGILFLWSWRRQSPTRART